MKATRKLLATFRAVILGVHAVHHEGAFKSCERCKEYRDIADDAKNEMRVLAELIAEKSAASIPELFDAKSRPKPCCLRWAD